MVCMCNLILRYLGWNILVVKIMNYFTQDELNQAVNAAVEATKNKMYEVMRENYLHWGYINLSFPDEIEDYIKKIDEAFNEHVSSGD